MLQMLRTGLGFRVAIMIAGFAALCFVAPPAVMAFGHGSDIVQCLAHGDAINHGVHGGAGHKDHGDDAKLPGNHAMSCCGLFCLSALAPALALWSRASCSGGALAAGGAASFGRVPDQPDRPPISLLSV